MCEHVDSYLHYASAICQRESSLEASLSCQPPNPGETRDQKDEKSAGSYSTQTVEITVPRG